MADQGPATPGHPVVQGRLAAAVLPLPTTRPQNYTRMPINPVQFYSNHHPQKQSPLFSVLPPEIRNEIFGLVLLEQDSAPFSEQDFWYRPDYSSARFIDTALLRACRLVYIETSDLPLFNVTYRQWLGNDDRKCPRCKRLIVADFC